MRFRKTESSEPQAKPYLLNEAALAKYSSDRPDLNCYTLPDGSCVGVDCMHNSGPLTSYNSEELMAEKSEPVSARAELLDEAKALVTGDRNNTYGPPTQDFKRSAEALTAYGYRKVSPAGEVVNLEAHDIAIMIDAVKTSRLMWTPGKRDSWADKAGYSACGWECAVEEGYADG